MRGKVLVDGPVSIEITGDLATIRGTSDQLPFALVLRIEDALISVHRFQKAHEAAMESRADNAVVQFPARRHADSA